MSHEITSIDKQQGTFQAWHGLTEIREDLTVRNNWLASWDVTARPLFIGDGVATPYSLLTATDDSNIQIGVPFTESYSVISNKMFLDVIEESLVGVDGVKLVSIGSVCGRNRTFASFEIDAAKHKVGDREFKQFWTVLNSFDKSSVFADVFSNVCTVCNNTFRMNLAESGKGDRVKHTKNAKRKLLDIPAKINAALGAANEFNKLFAQLEETPVKEDTAERIFAGFLGGGEEMSTRTVNTVDRLVNLFKVGAGNRGETLGDVFSAVTDFYSHESSGGDDRMKQWVSSEFGAAADKKAEFLPLIANAGERIKLIQAGKRSLELTAAAA